MKGAIIMAKSASVYARIDPALKEQAETILSALGIPTSNAIEKGYADILSGRTKPAKQAFAEMRKDFNICNLK